MYSAGRIPGGYVTNHIYTWVDPQGRSISPPSGLPQPHSSALRQHEGDRRGTLHLLQGGDEKKVSLLALALQGLLEMEGWWEAGWGRWSLRCHSPCQTQNKVRAWKKGLGSVGAPRLHLPQFPRCYCSVAQSCPVLCDSMGCITPGFPCPSISPGVSSNSCPLSQRCHPPSHPLLCPSPPTFNLSQHQGFF